ncbi:MAG TPA: hypothetical protein VKZ50_14120 [bacterium]|nr:hypothetical protein [bacterium]
MIIDDVEEMSGGHLEEIAMAIFGRASSLWHGERRVKETKIADFRGATGTSRTSGRTPINGRLALELLEERSGFVVEPRVNRAIRREVTDRLVPPAEFVQARVEGNSPAARAGLRRALGVNHRVADYLTGRKELPHEDAPSYAPHSEEEAMICARALRNVWQATPGAVEWLRTATSTKKSRKPRRS